MKATILILVISAFSICGHSQTINFVTKGVVAQTLPSTNDGGLTFSSSWDAYFAIDGNSYTQPAMGGGWYGFVQKITITVVSSTSDTNPINLPQIALDSANAYRQRVYPNIH